MVCHINSIYCILKLYKTYSTIEASFSTKGDEYRHLNIKRVNKIRVLIRCGKNMSLTMMKREGRD
jgi:hypothetical protein